MQDLNEILGTLPSGKIVRLDDDQMTQHLRDRYLDNGLEAKRRALTRDKLDFYNGQGRKQLCLLIDSLFDNADMRTKLKRYLDIASFNNISKRIINEVSTVYSESALRKVDVNDNYKALVADIELDRTMRHANRMVNLCGDVLLFVNVVYGQLKVKVITPDNFYAVCHPNDPSIPVAYILDQGSHKLVLTDKETFRLDDGGRMVKGSRADHGLSAMPVVLIQKDHRSDCLLDHRPSLDILNAHKALSLINVMLLKHQKSGTKAVVVAGDLSNAQKGQTLDSETPIELPEGTSLAVHDLEANPSSYIQAANAILQSVGQNHGLSADLLANSYSSSSGFEISIKRTGLREIRKQQLIDYRPVELKLVQILAEVTSKTVDPSVRAKYAFNSAGFGVNFGETEIPRDPSQMLAFLKEQRSMGLISTIDMIMLLNPEMSVEEAHLKLAANARSEAVRVDQFRKLNVSPDKSPNEQIFNAPSPDKPRK